MKNLDEEINSLFNFQNINSVDYSILKNIIEERNRIGIIAAISKAYFYGLVNGKRQARAKHRT